MIRQEAKIRYGLVWQTSPNKPKKIFAGKKNKNKQKYTEQFAKFCKEGSGFILTAQR